MSLIRIFLLTIITVALLLSCQKKARETQQGISEADSSLKSSSKLEIDSTAKGAADTQGVDSFKTEEVIKYEPTSTKTQAEIYRDFVIKGDLLYEQGDFKGAIKSFTEAKGLSQPDSLFDRIYYSWVSIGDDAMLNKDFSSAINVYKKAEESSVLENHFTSIGKGYFNLDNPEAAKPYLLKSAKKGDNEALFYMGLCLSREKDFNGSIEYLENSLQNGYSPELNNFYIGLNYFGLQDYEKALESLREVLKINPKNNEAVELVEKM